MYIRSPILSVSWASVQSSTLHHTREARRTLPHAGLASRRTLYSNCEICGPSEQQAEFIRSAAARTGDELLVIVPDICLQADRLGGRWSSPRATAFSLLFREEAPRACIFARPVLGVRRARTTWPALPVMPSRRRNFLGYAWCRSGIRLDSSKN